MRKLALAVVALLAVVSAFAFVPKSAHASGFPCTNEIGGCAGLCPHDGNQDYIGERSQLQVEGPIHIAFYIDAYSCGDIDNGDRQYEMRVNTNAGYYMDALLSELGMFAYSNAKLFDEALGIYPSAGCSAQFILWTTISPDPQLTFQADSGPMGVGHYNVQFSDACGIVASPSWPQPELFNQL